MNNKINVKAANGDTGQNRNVYAYVSLGGRLLKTTG